jgi:hypothetical protein
LRRRPCRVVRPGHPDRSLGAAASNARETRHLAH